MPASEHWQWFRRVERQSEVLSGEFQYFFKRRFRGLCGTMYQGIEGLCVHGRSKAWSSTQIALGETPKLLSKCSVANCKLAGRKLRHWTRWPLSQLTRFGCQTNQLSRCTRWPVSQLTWCGRKKKKLSHCTRWPVSPLTWCGLKIKRLSHCDRSPLSEWPSYGTQRTKPCIIVVPIQNLCTTLENTATMLYRCIISQLLTGS